MKIQNYMINNQTVKLTLKNIKGYSMHIYYYYKYNMFFSINERWIKNTYYKILIELYPSDWEIIYKKNILNIEKENLIKKIFIDNNENNNSKIDKYIIFGYSLLIRRAKLSYYWALDAAYNYTEGYE